MTASVWEAVLSAIDPADVVTVGMDLPTGSEEQLATLKTPIIASRNNGKMFMN